MTRTEFFALIRQSLADPETGAQHLMALNPPMATRWMLLAASVLGSVVLLYLLPVLTGEVSMLPSPFAFAGTQAAMNLLVIALITHVGRAFGGTGNFADAVWLVGWMQLITAGLLIAQIVVMLVLPMANVIVAIASIAVSIWLLVGFICALHGFKSRITVMVAGLMVFLLSSFVIAMVLLFFGFSPAEVSNV